MATVALNLLDLKTAQTRSTIRDLRGMDFDFVRTATAGQAPPKSFADYLPAPAAKLAPRKESASPGAKTPTVPVRDDLPRRAVETPDSKETAAVERSADGSRARAESEADSPPRQQISVSEARSNEAGQAAPESRRSDARERTKERPAQESGKTENTKSLEEAAVTTLATGAPQPVSFWIQHSSPLLELVENLREFSKSDESNDFVTAPKSGEDGGDTGHAGLRRAAVVADLAEAPPTPAASGDGVLGGVVAKHPLFGMVAVLASVSAEDVSPRHQIANKPGQSKTLPPAAQLAGGTQKLSEVLDGKLFQKKDFVPQESDGRVDSLVAFVPAGSAEKTPGQDGSHESGRETVGVHAGRSVEAKPAAEALAATRQIHGQHPRPSLEALPDLLHGVLAARFHAREKATVAPALHPEMEAEACARIFSTGNPQEATERAQGASQESSGLAPLRHLHSGDAPVASQSSPVTTEGLERPQGLAPAKGISVAASSEPQAQGHGSESGKDSGTQEQADAKPSRVSQTRTAASGTCQGSPTATGTVQQVVAERGEVVPINGPGPATAPGHTDRVQAVERLVDLASLQKKADGHQLELLLQDDRVGRVSLRLTERAGLVDAMLRTDSARGRDLLMESLPSLLDALARRGLEPSLASGDERHAPGGGDAFEQPGGRSRNPRHGQQRARRDPQPQQTFQVERE